MNISSCLSIAVYFAENWELLPVRMFLNKILTKGAQG